MVGSIKEKDGDDDSSLIIDESIVFSYTQNRTLDLLIKLLFINK